MAHLLNFEILHVLFVQISASKKHEQFIHVDLIYLKFKTQFESCYNIIVYLNVFIILNRDRYTLIIMLKIIFDGYLI